MSKTNLEKDVEPEFVARSITLSRELSDFADQEARKLATKSGGPKNLSEYIRSLIIDARRRKES